MRQNEVCVWSAVPDRAWFATLSLGCLGLVAVGLELQHLLRLSPCPLCIFQRVLYLAIAFLAMGGVFLPQWRALWSALIALLAAGGVSVAAYQSWMQAFPGAVTECGYADPSLIERFVDMLGMQWPSLFMATGFCSSKEWVFLGLSMANWSLLVYLGVLGYVMLLFRRKNSI